MPVNTLVYDMECFFCKNYVKLLKLRESTGGITLVSARDKEAVKALGLDHLNLNEGMALLLDGQLYYGDEAIHRLALLTTGTRLFNRINYAIFRHKALATLLYPLLNTGRKLYLKLAGKTEIE